VRPAGARRMWALCQLKRVDRRRRNGRYRRRTDTGPHNGMVRLPAQSGNSNRCTASIVGDSKQGISDGSAREGTGRGELEVGVSS
jgi:hypothetical protein